MEKKKLIIAFAILIIFIVAIIIFIKVYIENQNGNVDYDFSLESEENVFFTNEEEEEKIGENLDYISATSEEEKDENNSILMRKYTYTFKKPELYGKKLEINADETYIDGEYLYTDLSIRITDAFVTNVKIEKIYDNKNQIEFLDENKNPKTEFENGEKIVIKCPEIVDLTYVEYKINIEFVYNNEKYKIAVTQGLPVSDPYVGSIEATFYEEKSEDLLIGGEISLYRVIEEQDRTKLIGTIETGTDGKIKYYMVPIGIYKFIKIVDGHEIESDTFEVKKYETTNIEF